MKKIEKIAANVAKNSELMKNINSNTYYSVERFISDSLAYIEAIKNRSMFCIIESVSSTGMSRVINFRAAKVGKDKCIYYRNFYALFKALGFSEAKNGFRLYGCGMDMVFDTNYRIIHKLCNLGFMDKKTCDRISQFTPHKF